MVVQYRLMYVYEYNTQIACSFYNLFTLHHQHGNHKFCDALLDARLRNIFVQEDRDMTVFA